MPDIETNGRKIIRRLEHEGWVSKGGGEHAVYKHPEKPGQRIQVPRHKEISLGVGRKIAKVAGWI